MDNKRIQKKIGDRIRELRLKKGLTQEELANALGKKRSTLQRLESGVVNPSIYFLWETAKGLNISLEELLNQLK